MARISVIMATYNCKDSLRESIDSILNQTYTDWKFVICDDCSSDGTIDILNEYKENYPDKFIIIRNDVNSRLPFSLNHCLKYATGEFIARMDGDDVSTPDRFEKQVEFLDSHPDISVVGTSMTRFDENGEYDVYYAVTNPNPNTLLKEVPHCHATIMMRKSAMDAINGYVVSKRTVRGQDLDLWFRFYAKGFKGANIQEPLYKVNEGRDAIKRRKFKFAVYATQTKILGFKALEFPISKYVYAFIPVISHFIPRSLKLAVRKKK